MTNTNSLLCAVDSRDASSATATAVHNDIGAAGRTFGEIVAHIALVDAFSCEMGDGQPKSFAKVDAAIADDKPRLVALLKETDVRCTAYLATLTDSALSQVITGGKPPQTIQAVRGNTLIFAIAHANEHYGNLVTYLRAKGLVPPSAAAQAAFFSRPTPPKH